MRRLPSPPPSGEHYANREPKIQGPAKRWYGYLFMGGIALPRRGRGGILLLPLLLLTGCGRVVENKAEQAINELLPRYLGPADKYTTHVSGRADAMMRGRLRGVHIEGTNVRLLPDMTVSKLIVDMTDVSVNRGAGTVEKIGTTRFSARLTEGTVNRYATAHHPALHELNISLDGDGKVTVTTRPELLGYPTIPVSLRGVVRMQSDGMHLNFYPDAVQANVGIIVGTNLPGFVADHIASQLNPVTDLSVTTLPIVTETVTVERGAATLIGHIPGDALRDAITAATQKH